MQNTAMLGKTAVGKPVGVSIADKLFAEISSEDNPLSYAILWLSTKLIPV